MNYCSIPFNSFISFCVSVFKSSISFFNSLYALNKVSIFGLVSATLLNFSSKESILLNNTYISAFYKRGPPPITYYLPITITWSNYHVLYQVIFLFYDGFCKLKRFLQGPSSSKSRQESLCVNRGFRHFIFLKH